MLAVTAPLIIVKSTHPCVRVIRTEKTARGLFPSKSKMSLDFYAKLVEYFVSAQANLFASVNTKITVVREEGRPRTTPKRRCRTCPTTPRHVPRARDRETELPHHLGNVTKKQFGCILAILYIFLLVDEGG